MQLLPKSVSVCDLSGDHFMPRFLEHCHPLGGYMVCRYGVDQDRDTELARVEDHGTLAITS